MSLSRCYFYQLYCSSIWILCCLKQFDTYFRFSVRFLNSDFEGQETQSSFLYVFLCPAKISIKNISLAIPFSVLKRRVRKKQKWRKEDFVISVQRWLTLISSPHIVLINGFDLKFHKYRKYILILLNVIWCKNVSKRGSVFFYILEFT